MSSHCPCLRYRKNCTTHSEGCGHSPAKQTLVNRAARDQAVTARYLQEHQGNVSRSKTEGGRNALRLLRYLGHLLDRGDSYNRDPRTSRWCQTSRNCYKPRVRLFPIASEDGVVLIFVGMRRFGAIRVSFQLTESISRRL